MVGAVETQSRLIDLLRIKRKVAVAECVNVYNNNSSSCHFYFLMLLLLIIVNYYFPVIIILICYYNKHAIAEFVIFIVLIGFHDCYCIITKEYYSINNTH